MFLSKGLLLAMSLILSLVAFELLRLDSVKPDDTQQEAVLIGAGDIADCSDLAGAEATAKLLEANPGTVMALGDLAYPNGTPDDFKCYHKTWGRVKDRTRPAVGNHEFHSTGASYYFQYFGSAAGDPNQQVGGCEAGSSQEKWLRADLAAHPVGCTLAYFHKPRFSSGLNHGNDPEVGAFWQALYDYNAELILNGHDHDYERFAPQDPGGNADPKRGIREFVVGTGGKNHREFGIRKSNSEVRNNHAFGVLKLTLKTTGYDWKFIPEAGKTFTDSGSGSCH